MKTDDLTFRLICAVNLAQIYGFTGFAEQIYAMLKEQVKKP
jgi:hypothetical protein